MKLIKIIIKQSDSDIENIAKSKTIDFDIFTNILSNLEFVEFKNENDYTTLLCLISESYLTSMVNCLVNLSFDFSIEDITNKVLLSDEIDSNYFDDGVSVSSEIIKLIDDFYNKNINVDIILDKINLKGIKSLTDKDLKVLKNPLK